MKDCRSQNAPVRPVIDPGEQDGDEWIEGDPDQQVPAVLVLYDVIGNMPYHHEDPQDEACDQGTVPRLHSFLREAAPARLLVDAAGVEEHGKKGKESRNRMASDPFPGSFVHGSSCENRPFRVARFSSFYASCRT